MTLQEKLNKKNVMDLIFFLEQSEKDKNFMIVQTREIIKNYKQQHCVLPYMVRNPYYDYSYDLATFIQYQVKFTYRIIQKHLLGSYESATVSVTDDIIFRDKTDAELYVKYAEFPSANVRDNEYLKDIIDYTGLRTDYINLVFLKNIGKDLIAFMSPENHSYYFLDTCNVGRNSCFSTLTAFFESQKSEETKEKKIPIEEIKSPVDPKLEYIVREEIERTEKYLKTLKQII